jgi:hypothetical protein
MADKWLSDAEVALTLGISTKTLIRRWQAVPPTLPGAPLTLHGDGGKSGRPRCRRRWDPATVETWLRAADQYLRGEAQTPQPRQRPVRTNEAQPTGRMIDRVRGAR